MLGVEARSSLPHDQHDGGNLPGQGQTRHLRPDALGQQSGVELLKRTGVARCQNRRALKQILQIVIAVTVQSANGARFLHSLQLSVDTTVIGAALCLDAKSAERPATRPPGSARSTGSGRAVSRPGVSYSRRADPAALADAMLSVHPIVGSKTRPAGALPGRGFLP